MNLGELVQPEASHRALSTAASMVVQSSHWGERKRMGHLGKSG